MVRPEFGDRSDLIKKFAAGEWTFVERTWTDNDVLILMREGDAYSPQLYRSPDGATKLWYINLQDPVRRTPLGFDTLDHILDVFAGLDLSWWQLKDEHELAEAVELGVVTSERAECRSGGRRARRRDDGQRRGVVDVWSDWEPDRSRSIPTLPADWAAL